MRHLYVVIDMSQAMESQDLKPTRLLSALKVCAWWYKDCWMTFSAVKVNMHVSDKSVQLLMDYIGLLFYCIFPCVCVSLIINCWQAESCSVTCNHSVAWWMILLLRSSILCCLQLWWLFRSLVKTFAHRTRYTLWLYKSCLLAVTSIGMDRYPIRPAGYGPISAIRWNLPPARLHVSRWIG